MARKVPPRVHLLVICDEIAERWEGDTLHDLVGVRTQLTAPLFPYRCPQLSIYVQATGHQGTADCHVTVVRADDDAIVVATPIRVINFTGPTEFIHVTFVIADCCFPEAGVYYIQVHFDNQLRSERVLEILASAGDSDG